MAGRSPGLSTCKGEAEEAGGKSRSSVIRGPLQGCGEGAEEKWELGAPSRRPSPSCWGRRAWSGQGPGPPAPLPGHQEVSFVAVNNGPTALLGKSSREPGGRHADPEAGGCPVLRPPGDPRGRLPGISLQVSERLARPQTPPLDGGVAGFGVASPSVTDSSRKGRCLVPAAAPAARVTSRRPSEQGGLADRRGVCVTGACCRARHALPHSTPRSEGSGRVLGRL